MLSRGQSIIEHVLWNVSAFESVISRVINQLIHGRQQCLLSVPIHDVTAVRSYVCFLTSTNCWQCWVCTNRKHQRQRESLETASQKSVVSCRYRQSSVFCVDIHSLPTMSLGTTLLMNSWTWRMIYPIIHKKITLYTHAYICFLVRVIFNVNIYLEFTLISVQIGQLML